MPGLAELPQAVGVTFSFVLGAAIGSFLNVVIHRLPRGESILHPGSHCPTCKTPIPAWGNIPIVSYLALRGRCRSCEAWISPRYPIVEAATGVLFVALFVRWGLEPRLLISWALAAALLAIAFIDAKHKIIPNVITFPGIPLGLLCAWLVPPPQLFDAVLGLLVAGGMMWGIASFYEWRTGRIGLGMGDVKLVAMLGSFLGIHAALGIIVLGSVLGLLQGLLMMAVQGSGRRTRIPFGPSLAAAAIFHLFTPDNFLGLFLRP